MYIGWDIKPRIDWVLQMLFLLLHERWLFCSFSVYARKWKESVMAQWAKGSVSVFSSHLKWFLVVLVAFLKWELNFIPDNEVPRFIYRVRKALTLAVEMGKSFELGYRGSDGKGLIKLMTKLCWFPGSNHIQCLLTTSAKLWIGINGTFWNSG